MQLSATKIVVLLMSMLISLTYAYSQCVGPTISATDNDFDVNVQGPTTGAVLHAIITSITYVSCPGYNDGAIDITVSGGSPPYTFAWSNGSFDEDISNLVAGTYAVDIADANNCTTSLSNIVVIEDDHTLPVISCSANINQTADAGQCAAFVTVPQPTASDNCIVITLNNNYNNTNNATDTYPVGTTTIVWTVTDGSNNTATCAQTITITDDELATFTNCPEDNTIIGINAPCGATTTIIAPVAIDNCGVSSVIGTRSDGLLLTAVYPVGVTDISWIATDIWGNTSECKQHVIVEDNTPPVFAVCPLPDINANTDNNLCEALMIPISEPIATDDCSGVVLTHLRSDGKALADPYPLGTTVITWIATNINGDVSTCAQNVVVSDTEAPVFDCPTAASIAATTGGCDATMLPLTAPTGVDNCGTFTVMSGVRSDALPLSAAYPLGTTTITWTASDGHGNTATCAQIVLVQDTEAPAFTACPLPALSVSAAAGMCTANITLVAPATTDNCSGTVNTSATRSDGQILTAPYPIGNTLLTWLATDAAGNTMTCSQAVIVTDNVAPTFVSCPLADVVLTGCSAMGTIVAPLANDNCSTPSVSGTRSDLLAMNAPYAAGTTIITWTASDAAGNTATCTQNVIVNGNNPPQFTSCGSNTYTANANGALCWGIYYPTLPAATDDCGVPTVSGTRSDGQALDAPYPIGNTLITWTATDASGYTATCQHTITIVETIAPVFAQCPLPNIIVSTDAGTCFATPAVPAPAGSDNCGTFSVTGVRDDGFALTDPYPKGMTHVFWTAIDGNGNTAICTQNVIVNDLEAPLFSQCPLPTLTATTNSNDCQALVTVNPPSTTDNCGATQVAGQRNDGQALNVPYPVGTTTISWVAMDMNGNSNTCTQDVIVSDQTAPIFSVTCPQATISANAGPTCTANLSITVPTATDNCGSVASVIGVRSDGQALSADYPNGITTITWTATDNMGNSATCSRLVQVNDITPPTLVGVPSNSTVSCPAPALPTVTATDNCGSASVNVTQSVSPGNCTTGYTTTVTWTATDAAGNTSAQTRTITVSPSAPALAISNFVVTNAGSGQSNGGVNITVVGGSCGGAYTYLWGNGATTQDITGVPGGAWYSVTVTCGAQSVTGWYWVKNGSGRTKADELSLESFEIAPNPFSGQTVISLLGSHAQQINLTVYDMSGKEIAVLFEGLLDANTRKEVIFDGSGLPAGAYLCRLTTEAGEVLTEKVVLIR